ncbi:MAG TPA: RNA polymerase sigma factor [Polyangia bacterium]|nr:RNA polymerase sigma factor [Polyangia bacterium]
MNRLRRVSRSLLSFSVFPPRRVPPGRQTAIDQECLAAFQREVDYIYRTLLRLGADPSDVDDLVQEVFLALRRSWPDYDATRPLRPYLFGIGFRIVAGYRRKRRREIAYGFLEIDDESPGPEEALDAKEARVLLFKALERIPLPRRAVLIMHELDDVPVAEIAKVLSIPLFTVYSRLRKARRELQAAGRRLAGET